MPVIDQVGSSNESTVGIYISMQTQEERLTNDLRDIMREANILEELEGEKAEQENLEALKSIEGAAEENRDVETVDEEVDVESVWSPRSLIQVGLRKSKLFLLTMPAPLTFSVSFNMCIDLSTVLM